MLNPEKQRMSTSSALSQHQLKLLRKYAGKVDNLKYRNGKKHYFQFLQSNKTTQSSEEYVKSLLGLSYIQRTLKISSVKYYRDISHILNSQNDEDFQTERKIQDFKDVDEVVESLKEIVQANSRRNSQTVQNQQGQEVSEIIQMDEVLNSMSKNDWKKMKSVDPSTEADKKKKNLGNLGRRQSKTADFYKSFETNIEDVYKADDQNEQEFDSSVKYEIRSSSLAKPKLVNKRPKQRKSQHQKRALSHKTESSISVCAQSDEDQKQLTVLSSKICGKETKVLQQLQHNFLYRKHREAQSARQTLKIDPSKISIPKSTQKIKGYLSSKPKRKSITSNICDKVFQFIKSIILPNPSYDKSIVQHTKNAQSEGLLKKQRDKTRTISHLSNY